MRPALSAKRNFSLVEQNRDFHCETYAEPNFDLRPVLGTHLREINYRNNLIFFRTPGADFLLTFFSGKSGRPGVDFTGSQGTITTVPSQPGVFSPIGAVYPGRNGPKWWKWAHLGPKMGQNWCFRS